MRQIHPRISQLTPLPSPLPTAIPVPTAVTVDLRDVGRARHPSLSDEQRLRRQLVQVRRAVEEVMEQLSTLIDQRENLKGRLGILVASHRAPDHRTGEEDQSVVPWGFYDDDL